MTKIALRACLLILVCCLASCTAKIKPIIIGDGLFQKKIEVFILYANGSKEEIFSGVVTSTPGGDAFVINLVSRDKKHLRRSYLLVSIDGAQRVALPMEILMSKKYLHFLDFAFQTLKQEKIVDFQVRRIID